MKTVLGKFRTYGQPDAKRWSRMRRATDGATCRVTGRDANA